MIQITEQQAAFLIHVLVTSTAPANAVIPAVQYLTDELRKAKAQAEEKKEPPPCTVKP